jgi:hypothetical protein
MKRLQKTTVNILATTLLALAIFLCMWVAYDRGRESNNYELTWKDFRPDTVGVQMFTLNADPYDVDVQVIITPDTAKAVRLLRFYVMDWSISGRDLAARGVTFWPDYSSYGIPAVWLPTATTTPEDQAVVAHELTHVTHLVMDYAGVVYSDKAEEAFAYENGYLTRQFYDKLKIQNNTKNNKK